MAFDRIEHEGGAVDTTLASDITSLDSSLTLADSTGWPLGNVGPFYVLIDPGTASEEKMLATSSSGNVLSGLTRGVDGTGAFDHSAGVAVKHVYAALEADENNVVAVGTLGRITQPGELLAGLALNSMIAVPPPTDGQVLTGDSAVGYQMSWRQVNATMLASSVAGAGLAGGDGTPLSVGVDNTTIEVTTDTLNVKAAGIGTAQIADDAIDASKIAAGAVTTAEILDGTITNGDIGDAQIHAAKIAAEAWTAYTPTFGSISTGGGSVAMTVGNSTTEGAYILFGKTCHFRCSVTLGSSFSGGSSVIYSLTLPVAPKSGVRQAIQGVAIGPASHTTTVLNLTAYTDTAGGTTTEQIGCESGGAGSTFNVLGAVGNPVTASAWATSTVFQLTGTYETV